jgi:hypothetical protein
MERGNTNVEIGNKYLLTVPTNFKISSGTGDDTEFLQIYTNDGGIMMGYESGVEINKIRKSDQIDYLKENFHNSEKIKELEGKSLWMAYEKTQNKLRDIKGKVFMEHDGEFEEIMNFSCSSDKLNDVRQLIDTLREK